MAGVLSPSLRRMAGSSARALLPVGLAILLLAVAPAVDAGAYEGPGHRGEVPVGDGGLLAESAPALGEGTTHVTLSGIAPEICRIELEEEGAFANATLVWHPGNETAYIAGEVGARDVPFQVVTHWERDLNDECTVEVTQKGRVWHDPRGRPFIDLQFTDRIAGHDLTAGNWTRIDAGIHNNGTLPERVSVSIEHMRDHWEIRNATSFLNVEIEPLETVAFGFDLRVPDDEPGRTNLLLFHVKGEESGFKDKITLVLGVEGSGKTPSNDEEDTPGRIDQRGRAPPEEKPEQSGQIPMVSPLVGLLVIGFIVNSKRRSSRRAGPMY